MKEEPKEVWREITFTCPVRGKVTQRVKVKVYQSIVPPPEPLDLPEGAEQDP